MLHPALLTRREAVAGLAALAAPNIAAASAPKAKSVIFVFLTGGLSQLDSFDLKPDAPDTVRGEFTSIEGLM